MNPGVLTARKQVWLGSRARGEFHCTTLVREAEALGAEECQQLQEKAARKRRKAWPGLGHGISLMQPTSPLSALSQRRIVYLPLLGDLLGIIKVNFRCSLYGLVSTCGEEHSSITLNFPQQVEPVQEPSALDA